jgi:hypothetical protein
VVRAFVDIGVRHLRRIKEDMAAAKGREMGEADQDARDAEEALTKRSRTSMGLMRHRSVVGVVPESGRKKRTPTSDGR